MLELCAGYGGIGRGVAAACPGIRAVAFVERQAYAAAVLASRMVEGALDACPIWDSLESFPCELYRDRVDLVTAGFPCQGASVAGKRLGTDDERWLWPEVWRITIEVGARWLLVENVPGLLSVNGGRAFEEIIGDLASRGWIAEWDCISAGSVGAPHLRDRLFLLATDPDGFGLRIEPERDQLDATERRHAVTGIASTEGRSDDPDTDGERLEAVTLAERTGSTTGQDVARGDREDDRDRHTADADSAGCTPIGDGGELDGRVREARGSDVDRRRGSDVDRRRGPRADRTVEELASAAREHWRWERAPKPSIRGMDDGPTSGLGDGSYADQLHLLGNGVVSQSAAVAFATLWGRLHGTDLDVPDEET
jgi:site-specific DNA-cytosine methylase